MKIIILVAVIGCSVLSYGKSVTKRKNASLEARVSVLEKRLEAMNKRITTLAVRKVKKEAQHKK